MLQSWRCGRHNERIETAKQLKTKTRSTREVQFNYIHNVFFSICYFFIFYPNEKDPLVKSGPSALSSPLTDSSLGLVAVDEVNAAQYLTSNWRYKIPSPISSLTRSCPRLLWLIWNCNRWTDTGIRTEPPFVFSCTSQAQANAEAPGTGPSPARAIALCRVFPHIASLNLERSSQAHWSRLDHGINKSSRVTENRYLLYQNISLLELTVVFQFIPWAYFLCSERLPALHVRPQSL